MKKRLFCLVIIISITLCSLFGCGLRKGEQGSFFFSRDEAAESAFHQLTSQWLVNQMSSDPISCHYAITDPSTYNISFEQMTFPDMSYDAFKQSMKDYKRFLSDLEEISPTQLSEKDQLLYRMLHDYYTQQCAFSSYYYYANPLSPNSGIPSSLPVLLAGYRFSSKEDIDQYLQILDDVDVYFEQLFCFEKEKKEHDLLKNYSALKETAAFCHTFSEKKNEHMLVSSFAERLDACSFLSTSEKNKYKEENKELIYNVVLPSYQSLSDKLLSLYEDTDSSCCLCHLPNGRQYYTMLVACATGCEDSPFVLYQNIASQREQDMKEMADCFATQPSLATTISNVDCPLSNPEEMLTVLQDSISSDFPSCPKTNVFVHQISPMVADYSAPAYYLISPIDTYENQDIYYNPNCFPSSLDLFTTMAHEGFPGHLYQTCVSYENDFDPVRLLLSYPGYVEGWATYVENLSYQYAGLPENAAKVLALNQSILLSLYASADIGIHYYGWDQKSLLDFLSNYGIQNKEVAERIYNLILNDPANYLKYYVGYLNFIQLKTECDNKYGDSFSLMQFHRIILETGPAPFSVLRENLFLYFDNNA